MKTKLILALICFPILTFAQTAELKIKGEATVKAVPEMMVVNIPLEVKNPTYEGTSNELIQTYNNLKAAFDKNGIDKDMVESNSLNIRENVVYSGRERKQDGYIGTMQIHLEVNHESDVLNQIISTLNDERFQFGYSLGFALSEEQKSALLEEAIKRAVEDGKTKAAILTEALEVEIIGLAEINYEHSMDQPGIFQPKFAVRNMEAADAELEMNPSEMEISKSVHLIWKVSP